MLTRGEYATRAGHVLAAGAVFGLAVHYRVYPIIYGWPILLHLGTLAVLPRPGGSAALGPSLDSSQRGAGASTGSSDGRSPPTAPFLLRGTISPQGLAFILSAAATFLGLGALFWRLYGWAFLQETYLYHASRVDPRHNFSPFFYPAYLASGGPDPSAAAVGR